MHGLYRSIRECTENDSDDGAGSRCRYEILPIRTAVSSGLFEEANEKLTQAIGNLRASTASDYDSGR